MAPHLYHRPAPHASRLVFAALLHAASRALARAAQALVAPAVRRTASAVAEEAPCVEFHAEAGAPEGALYVDGLLVAHLPGVTRL